MKINIITSVDAKNGIGFENKLLFKEKEDMKEFVKITANNPIIMGRKTWDSLSKKLPNRINIVLSKQPINLLTKTPDICDSDFHKLIEIGLNNSEEISIIGGAEVYKLALPIATNIYLTKHDREFKADTFFPEIDSRIWKLISSRKHNELEFQEFIKL